MTQIKINRADEWQGVVFKTTDYSQFKHLVGNRAVADIRKNKILRSVKMNGQIYTVIIVNEKFEVIDGQGRLAAFQELGLPVNYVVVQGLTARDCAILNANTTNWTIADYIQSYTELGVESYVRLTQLIEKHKAAGMKAILYVVCDRISVINGAAGNKTTPDVREGRLVLSEETEKEADQKLTYAEEFLPYFKGAGSKTLIACGAAFAYDYVPDRNRLIERWKKYVSAKSVERPAASMDDVMKMLEACYNYKCIASSAYYLTTEYEKCMRARGRHK